MFTINTSSLSPNLIEDNGTYYLVYKNAEEGTSIKKLSCVYNQIDGELRAKKADIKTKELVSQLKKKYKVEIDKTGF